MLVRKTVGNRRRPSSATNEGLIDEIARGVTRTGHSPRDGVEAPMVRVEKSAEPLCSGLTRRIRGRRYYDSLLNHLR